ncbi:MAG TPA: NUDIX domain-containing protein [Candidatus Saccharimonadales bacterium]
MDKIHSLDEEVAFSGKIGEIIHTKQPDGRVFERYRRPPGTRLIIVSPDKKILLTKEHRGETGGIDLRLPGGKVRDTLGDYHKLLAGGQDMVAAAAEAAIKEAREETGLIVGNPRLIAKANAGATVEWDLYYFLVDEYRESDDGQQLEQGEDIEVAYLSPGEIRQAISAGEMQEWRSVGVLLGLVLPQLEM